MKYIFEFCEFWILYISLLSRKELKKWCLHDRNLSFWSLRSVYIYFGSRIYIRSFTTVIKDSFINYRFKKVGLVKEIAKDITNTYCITFCVFYFFAIKMIYAINISLLIPLRNTIWDLYPVTYFKHLHICFSSLLDSKYSAIGYHFNTVFQLLS